MLFLSFQEFLNFFSIKQSAFTKEELINRYYDRYRVFAQKHHLYTNGFDVFRECKEDKQIEHG